MIKYLLIISVFLISQFGFSQMFVVDSLALDTIKQIKEEKPIEASFLFSYYEQDGTKSPVTGGIGDEELNDIVGNISLNIPINDRVDFSFLGGMDVYSSASTDNINNEHGLYTESSASAKDSRTYGQLGIKKINEKKRFDFGAGVGASSEYDVLSFNYNAFIGRTSKNNNTRYFLKGSVYHDFWSLIYPTELRWKESAGQELLTESTRNTYNGLFKIEQDISPRMNASFTAEATIQKGLLSTPFHRVYFNDAFEHDIERLPNNRLKIPLGLRVNYYINKYMVLRLFYRYYFDDFEIQAHTSSIELPIKPSRSFTVAPFYRYHTQTAAKYFKQFGFHSINDDYYTSDFDLGDIESNRVGLELRFARFPVQKGGGKGKRLVLKNITIRGSKYYRERQQELILKSFIVGLQLSFRIE